jgi:hypothetical protein
MSGCGTFSPPTLRATAEVLRKPTKGAMAKLTQTGTERCLTIACAGSSFCSDRAAILIEVVPIFWAAGGGIKLGPQWRRPVRVPSRSSSYPTYPPKRASLASQACQPIAALHQLTRVSPTWATQQKRQYPYCRWLLAKSSAARASSTHPVASISSKTFRARLISVMSSRALSPCRKRP